MCLASVKNRSSRREEVALLEARQAAETARQEAEAVRREGHRRKVAATARAKAKPEAATTATKAELDRLQQQIHTLQ